MLTALAGELGADVRVLLLARGVDVGRLGPPAPQRGRQVRDPQGVPPAILGLEQGQLRAGGAAARGARTARSICL
jgi:hypothetical protein